MDHQRSDRPPPTDDAPPLSREQLKALFDYLSRPNPPACTNTFSESIDFLQSHGMPVRETVEWLKRNGAGCDCEVIFNTANDWGPYAGFIELGDED